MRPKHAIVVAVIACVCNVGSFAAANTQDELRARQLIANRAMSFEHNQGQTDAEARYLARGAGYTVFATRTGIVIARGKAGKPAEIVRLSWSPSGRAVEPTPTEQPVGFVNYLVGQESDWRTGIPAYSGIAYRSIYDGIDLLLYGNMTNLEFDFKLSPAADPGQIAVTVTGTQRLSLSENGDLIMYLGRSEFRQHRPIVYQRDARGKRIAVSARFKLLAADKFGFVLGKYDRSRELIIDPTLVYSSYLGGSGADGVYGVAVDRYNRVYATGSTNSANFPRKNARDGTLSESDAFITKFYATGNGLFYSTYLGGSGDDGAIAIAVDRDGNAYVAGTTTSSNFPGTIIGPFTPGKMMAFAVKLSPSGAALSYARRFGGTNDNTLANALALDSSHNLYVIGTTYCMDFPTTTGVVQSTTLSTFSTFVIKLGTSGARVFATYIGSGIGEGEGWRSQTDGLAIAVDGAHNVYAAGSVWGGGIPTTPGSFMPDEPLKSDSCPKCRFTTGWIVKLNDTASEVLYGTYLGGNSYDQINAIALDRRGSIYATGATFSTNFPITSGARQRMLRGSGDAFVTKVNASGSKLVYSTYLGGSGSETGHSIAVNSLGQAIVVGETNSANFPVRNALQGTAPGDTDAFVSKLWATGGGFHYSTYIGGSAQDVATSIRLDGFGNAYVGGWTTSSNFPAKGGYQNSKPAQGEDGFVLKVQ